MLESHNGSGPLFSAIISANTVNRKAENYVRSDWIIYEVAQDAVHQSSIRSEILERNLRCSSTFLSIMIYAWNATHTIPLVANDPSILNRLETVV